MTRSEKTALAITAVAAVALLLVLSASHLTFREPEKPSRQPVAEIAEIDEDFVEFFDVPAHTANPTEAYAPEHASHDSQAAEAGGTDLTDAGAPAAPPAPPASERKSPVEQPKKEKPVKTGPSQQELEAEARRRARQGIADAFKAAPDASDNTDAKGKNKGDSGSPDGAPTPVDGNGAGTVGGGWIMPQYAKVASHLTGRIELLATINSEGKVIKVEQTGGKAPAGADAALVAKCIAEVRRHTFTRTDSTPPPSATARIIYTFR